MDATMDSEMIESGISAVGPLNWGAHLCQFYKSRSDLIEMLIPYFIAGIERNEQCILATSEPFLPVDDARTLLKRLRPDIAAREQSGQFQILDHQSWFLESGWRDVESLTRLWLERQETAIRNGYAGLRVSGNLCWLTRDNWDFFSAFESQLTGAFEGRPIVAICCYSLDRCTSEGLLDVIQSHQMALVRRANKWDLIEASALKMAKEELRQLNEELEQRVLTRTAELTAALRMREEFISIASHELRTPVTSLLLYLESLARSNARGALSKEALAERLAKTKLECDRLENLVNYLLDISRAQSGQIPLSYEEMDLVEAARATAERFTGSLDRAGCTLSLQADVPVFGHWDRLRIEQVLVNLLSNAVKYAPGAPIEIAVSKAKSEAILSVRDHGPGIEPAAQRRIFERFVQLMPLSHRTGFGLGLWIVHQIVDAFQGSVELLSAPGEGTTFTIKLPLVPPGGRGASH
jgi:signal transduction histidine kinase